MENVSMTKSDGQEMFFDFFFVQGKQIRYIRIPDDVSL